MNPYSMVLGIVIAVVIGTIVWFALFTRQYINIVIRLPKKTALEISTGNAGSGAVATVRRRRRKPNALDRPKR